VLCDAEMLQYMNGGAASGNPFGAIAELRIRQAIRRGDFDGIAKKGQPLSDEDLGITYPYVSTLEFLSNRMMISQNALPPFIEQGKMIDADIVKWKLRLETHWLEKCQRDEQHREWTDLTRFRSPLDVINSRVNSYNVMLPTPVLPEKIPLSFKKEIMDLLSKHPPDPKHALQRQIQPVQVW